MTGRFRWHLRSRDSCALILFVTLAATGCGKASPIAPSTPAPTSPAPTPAPTPGPTPSQITVTGRITEAPPTTWTAIAGAVFTIVDGPNAGRSTATDNSGFYTLSGLKPGPMRVTMSADGYVSASQTLDGGSDTTANVQLMPVAKTVTDTLSGTIASTDGTCSDGAGEYACRIIAIPIHNSGPATATLTWTSALKLNVTLFQTGVESPIARGAASGANQQQVSATLPGGEDYEWRITVAAGTGSASYSLRVTRQN